MKNGARKERPSVGKRMYDVVTRIDIFTVFVHLVLITAGAFLALFLSNLQQTRNERKKEEVMLEQLQQALNADIQSLQTFVDARQRIMSETRFLRKFLDNSHAWNDSISILIYDISSTGMFYPHPGAFESLKSTGTNIVTNSEVRLGLFTLYEENFEALNRIEEYHAQFLNQLWVPYILDRLHLDTFPTSGHPVDFDKMRNDYHFQNLVTLFMFNSNNLLTSTRHCVMNATMLSHQIQFEIERLKRGNEKDFTPRKVTITLKGHADATLITIPGTFNNWDYSADTMKKTADGWSRELSLAPGWYMYKFRVDGSWLEDSVSADRVMNEYGTYNSLIKVE